MPAAKTRGSAAGRYGAKYGRRIRQSIAAVEREQGKQTCPQCFKPSVKRVASGIWMCTKCRTKFAGKAYFPT